MCGASTELSKSLDVKQVAAVIRSGRLRWFGHRGTYGQQKIGFVPVEAIKLRLASATEADERR